MPTPLTHFIAGAAISQIAPKPRGRRLRVVLVFGLVAAIQDLDFMAFFFDIPYNHLLGHRGFSHSLAVAVVLGIFGALLLGAGRKGTRLFGATALAAAFAAASHGLLDMVTNGGSGVGLLMPFECGRYFFPFRPILVSPFSHGSFISSAISMLRSEMLWVWLPLSLGSAALHGVRMLRKPGSHSLDWINLPLIGSQDQ